MSDQVEAGYVGSQQVTSGNGDTNAQTFLAQQLINRIATTALVKVVAVSNAGGVSPVGTVEILPLVNQIDGDGNATVHGQINNVPYFRLQGGTDAIILDPKVGDIGIAVFCSRDISAIKNTKAQGIPGSRRKYDWADALYIGGVLNGTPSQYVRFESGGIHVLSPTKVTITAPNVEVVASTKMTVTSPLTEMTGNLRVDGSVIGGFGTGDAIGLQTHTHTQAADSHGDTEAPTNAPTAGT